MHHLTLGIGFLLSDNLILFTLLLRGSTQTYHLITMFVLIFSAIHNLSVFHSNFKIYCCLRSLLGSVGSFKTAFT